MSGFALQSLCAQDLQEAINFEPCRADQDVWIRPIVKPNDEEYYEYVLIYRQHISHIM